MYTIFDLESDGLLEDVSKIHCLSYQILDENLIKLRDGTLTDYNEILVFILSQECLVGHNIILYDIPVLEKIIGFKVPKHIRIIDTLGLSWHLFDDRQKHGLEKWGEDLGVEKPTINSWTEQTLEDYIHRCQEDVKINTLLFIKQMQKLFLIYDGLHFNHLINYITFILSCYRHHYENPVKMDVELINRCISELSALQSLKVNRLISVMPKQPKYKTYNKPKNLLKKDGSYSSLALKWFERLKKNNLPIDYEGSIQELEELVDGNPNSSQQVKDWLYLLGWKPKTFARVKNKEGIENEVPQIYNADKEVCQSVKDLYHIEPELENLDQLSLIEHRIGVFNGFLRDMDKNGYMHAEMKGLAPTFRVQHSKIVNLPKVFKFYGKEIRGSFIVPDKNHIMCGFDLSNIEDRTKRHYIYPYDPKYVEELRDPTYDAHLNLGVISNIISKEEEKFYIWYKNGKK